MALIDDKRDIFGQIAALRTLNEGFPDFNLSNSFPSIDNGKDSLAFLTDLLKALAGFEELRDIITNIFTYELDNISDELKAALKIELKKLVSCGVNPSIPQFLLHQSIDPLASGVDLELSKVDFTGLMYIDPQGELGNLFYDDVNSGVNSTDFNTFLYNTIQNDGSQENWGGSTSLNDILSIEFNSVGTTNNVLNIKASSFYSNPVNGKTLTDLNNDFIDSIELFSTDKLLNNIVDTLYGSVSIKLNKTQKQLEQEAAVENIVECILNSDESDVIDNSYFEFSNEEIMAQQEIADNRRKGIRKVVTCEVVETSIPTDSLQQLSASIATATTKTQQKAVVSDTINNMGDQASSNVQEVDKYNLKLNFIEGILRKIMLAIVNVILSPKLILIFVLNHKIINGVNATFDSAIDFMKQNKALVKGIINRVRDIIIEILLKITLKKITELVGENAIASATEKAKNAQAQLLSLVGVPQEVLRIIQGLG